MNNNAFIYVADIDGHDFLFYIAEAADNLYP